MSETERPSAKLWNILVLLKENLIWSIPMFMILGLVFGALVQPAFLRSWILPLTFLMVYPMMVNLQLKKVLSGQDYKLQSITLLVSFGLGPLVAYGLGRLFFPDQVFPALGLLLAATLPTSGMTISWTGFARGNINAAIKMTVLALIIGALVAPLYVQGLMGTAIEIPVANMFRQILLIVFLPMVLGYATQRLIIYKFGEARYRRERNKFPVISTLGVLGIVFVAMALKANTILSDPSSLLLLLIPLVLFYGFNFLLSTVLGKLFFERNDAIALVYGTVPKNLSVALAVAMNAFGQAGSEIALIIALAFILQVQSAAWYIRFVDRIFGTQTRTRAVIDKPLRQGN